MIFDRKIQERAILDHFRMNYPEFPKGRIIPTESPDFIIKTSPKKSIGIELSSLPSPSYHIRNKTDLQQFLSDVQSSLSKKEEKIRIYRKTHAHEFWLILHVDFLETVNINFDKHLERSGNGKEFSRVFLFDVFEGRIYLHN